jgi:hypothetical protein
VTFCIIIAPTIVSAGAVIGGYPPIIAISGLKAARHAEHLSREHCRLNEDAMSHREKRRHAGECLRKYGGLVLREFK